MEYRWYLSPGQTLANTKIQDRQRALHMTADKFKSITDHLDRNRKIQEKAELEESHRRYLEEGSNNMIKNWDNSVEKIMKTRISDMKKKQGLKELKKAERLQAFFKIRKEQEDVRQEYINRIRTKVFRNEGMCRDLSTAFRHCEVLYGRKLQEESKQQIKAHDDEVEAEFIKENAKLEVEEKKKEQKMLYEKERQLRVDLKSAWFLFPGQTLENTRIEDRGHALHITADKYEEFNRHLDRNRSVQEMLEKEEAKRKYLAEGSRNMIKNWDNSLENITKRKEEERLRRIEANKTDKVQRFFNIRKEQEKVREEYIDKVKKKMFRDTGMSKDLTSAFRLSEVLFERGKQQEHIKFIQAQEDKEDAEFAEFVKKNAIQEIEEKKEMARKLFENKKQYGNYLMKVIEENAANTKKLNETTKMKEIKDNLRSIEEMEIIKRKEKEMALQKKRETKLNLRNHINEERERQKLLEEEEREKDEVVAIFQEAKHRIDCLKKDKEKELQEAIIARREEVSKIVRGEEEVRNKLEEEQLQRALEERDAIDEMKRKKKEEYLAKIRRERIEDRERFILDEEEKKKRDMEMKKWDMLNRYKRDEVMKVYENNLKKEEWNKILQYRQVLLDQMEDNERERLREKEISDFNALKCFDGEDAQFFEYANEVMELAKRTGRTTYPIEKVIMSYKRINKLKVPVCEQSTCEGYIMDRKQSKARQINATKQIPSKCMKSANK